MWSAPWRSLPMAAAPCRAAMTIPYACGRWTPARNCPASGDTLSRSPDAAFTPDGRYVLSGSYDLTLRLWRLPRAVSAGTRRRGPPLRGARGEVWGVALAPDGRRAVSCGEDRTVRQWDVDTGKEIRASRSKRTENNVKGHRPDFGRLRGLPVQSSARSSLFLLRCYRRPTTTATVFLPRRKNSDTSVSFIGGFMRRSSGWLRSQKTLLRPIEPVAQTPSGSEM